MDYEFTAYTPRMLSQVAALRFAEWLEEPHFVADYLAWKFEANPYSEDMRLYVALADGKVAATRGVAEASLGCGAESIPVAFTTENLVSPQHQGRGLSNRLTRFALDQVAQRGVDFAVSLGANRTTQLLSRRSGWERVCAYRPLRWGTTEATAPVEPRHRSGLRRMVRGSRFYPQLRNAWARVRNLRERSRSEAVFRRFDAWAADEHPGMAVEYVPRPQQMAALVGEAKPAEPRIGLVRDERYYGWRYADPRSSYRFLFAESGGSLDAFLVLQQRRPVDEVAVVDWQARDGRAWLDLLRAVIESGSVSALSIWSATLAPEHFATLETLDFRPDRDPDTRTHPARGLLVTATRPGVAREEWTFAGRSLLDPENWDLRMIFSDFY